MSDTPTDKTDHPGFIQAGETHRRSRFCVRVLLQRITSRISALCLRDLFCKSCDTMLTPCRLKAQMENYMSYKHECPHTLNNAYVVVTWGRHRLKLADLLVVQRWLSQRRITLGVDRLHRHGDQQQSWWSVEMSEISNLRLISSNPNSTLTLAATRYIGLRLPPTNELSPFCLRLSHVYRQFLHISDVICFRLTLHVSTLAWLGCKSLTDVASVTEVSFDTVFRDIIANVISPDYIRKKWSWIQF